MRVLPVPGRVVLTLAGFLLFALTVRADSLEDGFRHPPESAKPQTWWHWMNGEVTREGITLDLEAMQRVGIGGAQIFNVDCGTPAGPATFLGPEWRELMQHAVREADRLGLEITIHNGAGWSSSGGPWNTPEHAMQRVTTGERFVTGPAEFDGVLPMAPTQLNYYREIAVLAFPVPHDAYVAAEHFIDNIGAKGGFDGSFVDFVRPAAATASEWAIQKDGMVDLTGQMKPDGRLSWKIPAGDWIILRVGYTPTGEQNHPAPAAGAGLECDKFSQEALDAHWAGFVQKVLDDAGPLAGAGKTLDGVLIDSYEVGGQNWSPQFRAEFTKRRGYDPLLYLPVLTGRVVDSPEISERFLWDMRRTIADLFADNYYGHFQELCHAHGLKANFEPYRGPFDSMQSGARADIPMGEFWVGGQPDPSIKLASSIGHVYGRTIIGAESFTGAPARNHGRWLDDAYSLKTLGDLVFCRGINRFIFHRYAMQPWTNRWPGMTMGQWGTHFDRTSTWWEQSRAWLEYITRCQYLLQQGLPVADAAYFSGENAPAELRAGEPALPPGHDWDMINADALLHHAAVKDGWLVLDSGAKYSVLILPPSDREMRPELLGQLSRFVADGLTLVGAPPDISPSLENYPACDAEIKRLSTEMWGNCDGQRVTEHPFGRGTVIWGKPMAQVFAGLDLKPDFENVSGGDASLAFIHRHDGDDEIYFVSNQRRRFDAVECAFRVSGKTPELWDAQTGAIMPAPVWREEAGRTLVSLSLEPAGSMFVIFRMKAPTDHLVALHYDAAAPALAAARPVDLQIVKAVYGDFSSKQVDVTARVKSMLAAGAKEIPAGNGLADDDPAPNFVKRLRVEYELNGEPTVSTTTEGGSFAWPPRAVLVSAWYGDITGGGDSTWVDVTGKVSSLVAGGTSHVEVGNGLAGLDPVPNVPKEMVVEFRVNGENRKMEIPENSVFDVPPGAVISKAMYGSPRTESLHRSFTVDLTKKLAGMVNQGVLNVTADNTLAGGDPAPMVAKELRLDYLADGKLKHATVQENDQLTLPEEADSASTEPFDFAPGPDGQARLLAWIGGKFDFSWASGRKTSWDGGLASSAVGIAGPWQIDFPPGWNAPAFVTLDRLQSWTKSADPGVKYFSGTATYVKEIEIPEEMTKPGRELWLELGAVKNFAEVSVNGQSLGILWKPPFRVNITAAARPGANAVRIKVTNLWPNRLIGDEQLPDDRQWSGGAVKAWPEWLLEGKPSPTGRVTFTTWHHWKKDDALLESGLLGPVTVRAVEEVELR